MKSAEEILSDFSISYGGFKNNSRAIVMATEAIEAMIEFAKAAIAEDRENLLNHAEVYFDEGTTLENVHIDKDSIINSPQIKIK